MILEKPLHTGAGFSMVFCGGATAIFLKKMRITVIWWL
jgi:hypothetical protein